MFFSEAHQSRAVVSIKRGGPPVLDLDRSIAPDSRDACKSFAAIGDSTNGVGRRTTSGGVVMTFL